MSDEPRSARDIIARVYDDATIATDGESAYVWADELLDELTKGGHTIVQLPKPTVDADKPADYYIAARDSKGGIRLRNGKGILVALPDDSRADIEGWFSRATEEKWSRQYFAALQLLDREAAAAASPTAQTQETPQEDPVTSDAPQHSSDSLTPWVDRINKAVRYSGHEDREDVRSILREFAAAVQDGE